MRPRPRGIVTLVAVPVSLAVWLSGCTTIIDRDPNSGNETSAILSLKAIALAQTGYRTVCGNGGYAASLVVLRTPPGGGSGEGFIDAALGASNIPQKSGYMFTMTAGAGSSAGPKDCNGTPTVTAFYATAVPILLNETGTRSFAVNQLNLIWQLTGGIAPTEPFGPPAYPIQ